MLTAGTNQKWLHHPCRLRGHQCSPRGQIRNGYFTPAASGVTNAHRGDKSEMATSPLPPQGSPMLTAGTNQKWLHHPCRLRGHQCSPRGQIRNGYFTPAASGVTNAHRGDKSEMATSPLPPQGSPMLTAGTNQKWLLHPCRLRGHQCSPRGQIRNGYFTPAASGVTNAHRGDKSEMATSPLPSWGPKMSTAPLPSLFPPISPHFQKWGKREITGPSPVVHQQKQHFEGFFWPTNSHFGRRIFQPECTKNFPFSPIS